MASSEQKTEPRIGAVAATIRAMLHELGVQEYEPRVVSQLLDVGFLFLYRTYSVNNTFHFIYYFRENNEF